MKIAFSLPVYWPAIGGCECLTHELARILSREEGVDVRVITQIDDQDKKTRAPLWFNTTCYPGERGERHDDDGVQVHLLGLGRILSRSMYPFVRYHHRFPRLSTQVIVRAFQGQFRDASRGCQIIHCIHNGLSYYGVLSQTIARELNVPFVFSPTLHLYHEGWHEEMMEAVRSGEDFQYVPRLHMRPRGYHDQFWMKLCREADALVTWTRFEKDFLADRGISAEKIFPLRLGPILSEGNSGVEPPACTERETGIPAVLFLGRNHELKGVEEILRATADVWSKYPETRFLFVGPKEGKTPELFQAFTDPRIVVLDRVTEAEKFEIIRQCDIFCVPSLHESFGIVFLEAWHHEKPIIAADIPPIRELNPGNGGGFLIRPNPEEIAGAIIRLLDDPSLRRRMGEWGKRRVDTHYQWDDARDRLIGIYEGILDKRKGSS
jgi:glycosyltransferase involved in cell wall biosynthesis